MPSDLALKTIVVSVMVFSTVMYAVRVPHNRILDRLTLWLGRLLCGFGFVGYLIIGQSAWFMNFALATCVLTYLLSFVIKHCMVEVLCSPLALLAAMCHLMDLTLPSGPIWVPALSAFAMVTIVLLVLVHFSKNVPRQDGPRWSFDSFPRFWGL